MLLLLLLLLFKFRSFRIGAFSLPASGKTIPATGLFRHSGAQRGIAGGNLFDPGQPAAKGKTTHAVYGDGGGTPERGLQMVQVSPGSELLNFTGASTRGDCYPNHSYVVKSKAHAQEW